MKRVIECVTSDLLTDNRVDKTCRTIAQCDYSVLLVGRIKSGSKPLDKRSYPTKRFRLIFDKSFLFYAEYNLREFFFLLTHKFDIVWANDLDTLLGAWCASRIKRKPIIFDSHEHFTQVPELKENAFARWFWTKLEEHIVPRLKNVLTVSQPIADYFKDKYGVSALVVRNAPLFGGVTKTADRAELLMPQNNPVLIWQGGGCNVERGLEELVQAMQWIDACLYIIGGGDIFSLLQQQSKNLGLEDKIFFVPRVPYEQMMQYTFNATLGLSLDKPTNGNYAFSLPNKLFEYVHAQLPMLITPLCEIKPIVQTFKIGTFLSNYNPQEMAQQINALLKDEKTLAQQRENCKKAAHELCWQNEENKIEKLLSTIK